MENRERSLKEGVFGHTKLESWGAICLTRLAIFVVAGVLYANRDPKPTYDPGAFKRDCFEAKNLLNEFLKWPEF